MRTGRDARAFSNVEMLRKNHDGTVARNEAHGNAVREMEIDCLASICSCIVAA